MQVFVRGDCTMIAAPVQCDVDGVPKGSHFARVPPMGYTGSVAELETRIDCWASHWNDNPDPFVWTKPADEILDKVARGRATLDRITKSATHHWLPCPASRWTPQPTRGAPVRTTPHSGCGARPRFRPRWAAGQTPGRL